jgi:hypothetical protein
MVCVEAAVIGEPVQLAPGKTWSGMQRIELVGREGWGDFVGWRASSR